jgi:hypothetical protein
MAHAAPQSPKETKIYGKKNLPFHYSHQILCKLGQPAAVLVAQLRKGGLKPTGLHQ